MSDVSYSPVFLLNLVPAPYLFSQPKRVEGSDLNIMCTYTSLVPRPSSTFTFGGPGMPNQIF